MNFLHLLAATTFTELVLLSIFTFVHTKQTDWSALKRYYKTFRLTAYILDTVSLLIGFYLAHFGLKLFSLSSDNILLLLFGCLVVQIFHDYLFYIFAIIPYNKKTNKVMLEFKSYAKDVSYYAIIGDSLMYVTACLYLQGLKFFDAVGNETLVFLILAYVYASIFLIYDDNTPSKQTKN